MSEPREGASVPVTLSRLRRRLEGGEGPGYWKSLDELARSPAVAEQLRREFPAHADEFEDPVGRRQFLRLMGASIALAGLTGCTRQPDELIVPYVKAPEDMVPGRPQFFATAVLDGGYAKGVLVESHMGRPTKIEGNPEHPSSLGATDHIGQAEILSLYDPDRSQTLTYRNEIRTWEGFIAAMRSVLAAQTPSGGAGLRILTETVTSPTQASQLLGLLAAFPRARWHQWDAGSRHSARAAATAAFGRPVETLHHFGEAEVVVTLDGDFVGGGPGNLRAIREFVSTRRLVAGRTDMSRLYAIESSPTLTGSLADHRLPVQAAQVEDVARALAAALGAGGGMAPPSLPAPAAAFVAAVAKDLLSRPAGRTVIVPGEYQTPAVYALGHAINERLGNVGRTVSYVAPAEARPVDQIASIRELAEEMGRGQVQFLLVLGGNPAFTAPADLDFRRRMDRVNLRVHHGLYEDETAELCHWHVPATHSLETWSDARSEDGTVTILQPLIAPLYPSTKSVHEVLAAFSDRPVRSSHDIVRERWLAQGGLGRPRPVLLRPGRVTAGAVTASPATATSPVPAAPTAVASSAPAARASAEFERQWRRALHDGLVAGSASEPVAGGAVAGATAAAPPPAAPAAGWELIFRPDPNVVDGRYANNGWLQELPKPLTKLTWDNAAIFSPAAALRLGVTAEATSRGMYADVVELRYRGRSVQAPALILPGHPDESVTVHFGYGRRRTGQVGTGAGFDAFRLRTSDAPWFGGGLEVSKTGEKYTLAVTQDHWSMEGRPIVAAAGLEEYRANPDFAREAVHHPPKDLSLYPEFRYEGHAWGMAIDLNACVGCNACVVACQSENSIPVVGKEQVAMNREMHWLRIDRYYSGPPDNPATYHQPMMCVHCEKAPCEPVCPVAATVHSDEGLNDMVYNRCVGTRYCSNNCPYKVRRFNFFLYADWETTSLKLMRNPDVTVRSRGVMEKCTYCVQRINQAKMAATTEGRKVRDGDIVTACQGACPGRAIVFGDINDPQSAVARLKAEPRAYGVLADLNTRPRTSHLGAVRNPNPELPRPGGDPRPGGHGGVLPAGHE
ncbi:MAG TPA: TAT-variant-translocated molybdopterin oxidoreductase [Vicinamibacteria bacterium]|nr:TAT-variant-translocated molybdopterin oxidoreductase [Vicinamibacteria bacterium]